MNVSSEKSISIWGKTAEFKDAPSLETDTTADVVGAGKAIRAGKLSTIIFGYEPSFIARNLAMPLNSRTMPRPRRRIRAVRLRVRAPGSRRRAMAVGRGGRSFGAMTTRSLIPLTLAALVAANLAGFVVGVHDGFASLGDAAVNGTYTNAPLPVYGLQIAGVALLLAGRGRAGAIGGGLVLLACTVSRPGSEA